MNKILVSGRHLVVIKEEDKREVQESWGSFDWMIINLDCDAIFMLFLEHPAKVSFQEYRLWRTVHCTV